MNKNNIVETINKLKQNKSAIGEISTYIQHKTREHEKEMKDKKQALSNLMAENKDLSTQVFSVNLDTLVDIVASQNNISPENINAQIIFNTPIVNSSAETEEEFRKVISNQRKMSMALVVEDKRTHETLATFKNPLNSNALQQDGKPLLQHIRFRSTNYPDWGTTTELICDNYRKLKFEYATNELNTDGSVWDYSYAPQHKEAQYIIAAIEKDYTNVK